jgi:sialic acid synthase SpsE
MRGEGPKRVLPLEQDVRTVSRQSLVAARPIKKGQTLGEGDLRVQRPGTGMSPKLLPSLLGRMTVRDIAAGEMLTPTMLG